MAVATSDGPRGLRRAFAALSGVGVSLRIPAYRWWFVSQILSASGAMTQSVAQSWLLYELTGNALYLGLLSAALCGPVLLLGPFAGTLVDGSDRRLVLLCTQVLFMAIGTALTVLSATGSIEVWMLFVSASATGVVMAVDGPARQVYVLELVGT